MRARDEVGEVLALVPDPAVPGVLDRAVLRHVHAEIRQRGDVTQIEGVLHVQVPVRREGEHLALGHARALQRRRRCDGRGRRRRKVDRFVGEHVHDRRHAGDRRCEGNRMMTDRRGCAHGRGENDECAHGLKDVARA